MDNITTMLMPFLIGIGICSVCLAGSSYAWFTASMGTGVTSITAANYDIEIFLKKDGQSVNPTGEIYKLEAGSTYVLTLKPEGSATTGYCKLRFGTEDNYTYLQTAPIAVSEYRDKSFSITLEINEAVDLKIIHEWGTSASKEKKLMCDDRYVHGVVPEDGSGSVAGLPESDSKVIDKAVDSEEETAEEN